MVANFGGDHLIFRFLVYYSYMVLSFYFGTQFYVFRILVLHVFDSNLRQLMIPPNDWHYRSVRGVLLFFFLYQSFHCIYWTRKFE